MAEKLEDVWANRDFPVLVEITKRIDRGESGVTIELAARSVDMPVPDVERAFAALRRRGLASGVQSASHDMLIAMEVSSEAYFLTGLHPDGALASDRLISALNQAADAATDPEETSKLRRAAEAVGNVSSSVISGVLTAVITGAVGAG